MKVLVCADIHGNKEALKAVLTAEKDSFFVLLSLGDMVGYGADSEACIKILKKQTPAYIIRGNHDAALVGLLNTDWFAEHARHSVFKTRSLTSNNSKEWIQGLDDRIFIDTDETILAVHGAPNNPLTGYLWGGEETLQAFEYMACHHIKLCFAAHTHLASVFSYDKEGKISSFFPVSGEKFNTNQDGSLTIVNPGSVGRPRFFNAVERTGFDAQPISQQCFPAHYCIWDAIEGTVEYKEVRYDSRPAELKIRLFMQ